MPQCYVTSCSNYYGKTRGSGKIIYHMLPTAPEMVAKWAKLCGYRNEMPPPYARICSDHFSPSCYQRDLQHELLGLPLRKKLKSDTVPDQNLPGRKAKLKNQEVRIAIREKSTLLGTKKPKSEKADGGRQEPKQRLAVIEEIEQAVDGMRLESSKEMNTGNDPLQNYESKSIGDLHCQVLKNKNNVQYAKNNNKLNRRPMRSSIRIAKKKSIESLSDSFTSNVNDENERCSGKPERFSDKIRFMAMLQLKHERNSHCVIDLDTFFDRIPEEDSETTEASLNKMQIMEDVREGCNVQPSSPGHADQRSDESQPKSETIAEAGLEDHAIDEPSEAENTENDKVDKSATEVERAEGKVEVKAEPDAGEENYSNASSPTAESNKRKSENDEFPVKRLRAEIHENFASRDKILNEFIDMAECNNLEQLHTFSEQLLAEVKTLNELAKEKEREWNNIIHLKKLKEELLLRMQRKRQILMINDKTDYSELFGEPQNETVEERLRNSLPQSILKSSVTSPRSALRIPSISLNGNSIKHRNIIPKPHQNAFEMNGSADFRQGKRLTLDVQSIIADYRQRHPEAVPRRGRRIRQPDGTHKYSNSVLNFSSMALGSGSQVRQGSDVSNELNVLLNTINMNRQEGGKPSTADPSTSNSHDGVSFKDMLVQFAKLSQSERNELIQNAIKPPPPYPEVTVHPVPTTSATATPAAPANSLLHGILTKTPPKQVTKSSFSPTLARLLTAPERAANNLATSTPTTSSGSSSVHPSNMSISEILSSSKAHNEITITPVETQFEATSSKARNLEEEEAEDSADRLVIDENNEAIDARKQPSSADNSSEAGDEVPPCQGCNQKAAQFVCAGCGNQWYCSRDCQVSAWDEHSEVCSG